MFFVIWGFKRYVTALAMLTLVCGHCQRPTAHPLRKVITKVTLFWIPLFQTSTKHVLQCSYCGYAQQVSTEESERLLASATAPTVSAEPPVGSMPPRYQDRASE